MSRGELLILQRPCQGRIKQLLGLRVLLRLPALVQGQGYCMISLERGGHTPLQEQIATCEDSGTV